MKQHIHTFIMGVLTLFSVYLYVLSAESLVPQIEIQEVAVLNIVEEEENALNYLNTLRTGAGLLAFKTDSKLNTSARSHAQYLTNHLTFGHYEDSKFSDYTGKYASMRIMHVGYISPLVIENASTMNRNYKESVDNLFAAIYHRLAFLNTKVNTIGIGISQNQQKREHTSFVFNMSTNDIKKRYANNSKIITYPFNNQKDLPPAFFDERPDPLPSHKVSGFPISISFDTSHYKKVQLIQFKLYNQQGEEVKETLIMNQHTDPNHQLGTLDFVLFPLKRLNWDESYSVKFVANVDHKIIKKSWSFHTRSFNLPFHIINTKEFKTTLRLGKGEIFYFPPKNKSTLLEDIRYPTHFDIEFIDQNTIKLTALNNILPTNILTIGNHKLHIKIKK